MCTPTWRADQSRISEASVSHSLNLDCVRFLQEIRNAQKSGQDHIKIGGLLGCKNDCYQPDKGLSTIEAEAFHAWQVEQLVTGGVDFLIAETLPNIQEATGIARVMEKTGKPYIISFVISREGKVLDGTDLAIAVSVIDSETNRKPLGYMVNCAYPSFLCASNQPERLFDRLIGYLANASSLDHCDLENANQLEAEEVSEWGEEMLKLNRSFGIKLLGGCCGTGNDHLKYIVKSG